jgi:hypothetical protein
VKKLLAFVLFVGISAWAQAPVAIVNGEPITKEELDSATRLNQILFNLYFQYPQFAQVLLSTPEGKAFLDRYQREVLENLILRKIQLQEARARGLTPSAARVEELVNQALDYIKNYYGLSDEELVAELAAEGLTLEQFKKQLAGQAQEQALLEALKEAVTGEVQVSEDEIAAYYAQNPGQFLDAQGNARPLEDVKNQIYSVLLAQKKDQVWEVWLKEARAKATVQVNL